MRIYGKFRESEMMKIVTDFQWSNRRPALLNLSGTKPRPFLEISDQGQLRSKGTKKNSVMKVVNRRGERWLPTGPPSPPPPVQVPPLRPNLGAYGFGQLSQFEDDTWRKNDCNYFSFSRSWFSTVSSGKSTPGPAVFCILYSNLKLASNCIVCIIRYHT